MKFTKLVKAENTSVLSRVEEINRKNRLFWSIYTINAPGNVTEELKSEFLASLDEVETKIDNLIEKAKSIVPGDYDHEEALSKLTKF